MRTKKIITVFIITAFIVALIAGCDSNKQLYADAEELLNNKQYAEAADAFAALEDYKDAPARADEARYMLADTLFDSDRYPEAAAAFEALGDYKDAADRAEESRKTNSFSAEGFTITYKILTGDDREIYKFSSDKLRLIMLKSVDDYSPSADNPESVDEHEQYITILFTAAKKADSDEPVDNPLVLVAEAFGAANYSPLDGSKLKIWIDGELYTEGFGVRSTFTDDKGLIDFFCHIKAPEDFSEIIITYE